MTNPKRVAYLFSWPIRPGLSPTLLAIIEEASDGGHDGLGGRHLIEASLRQRGEQVTERFGRPRWRTFYDGPALPACPAPKGLFDDPNDLVDQLVSSFCRRVQTGISQ